MRTATWRIAVIVLPLGCIPVSVQPTYHENQLISIPGLEGVWRDSVEGDEIVLTKNDSVSYIMGIAEGENAGHTAMTYLAVRTARRNGVTFVDLVPPQHYEVPEPELPMAKSEQGFLGWHFMPLHAFFLIDVERDRLVLRTMDSDTLKAVLERSPRAASHVMSDDRVVLTGPTEQVQSFLIRTSLQPGKTKSNVYKRVPDDASCEEGPREILTLERREADSQTLRAFGVELRRAVDAAVLTMRVRSTSPYRLSDGLLASGDSTPDADVSVTLSQATPLVLIGDRRVDRRLELRWHGVDPNGAVIVHAFDCHESFASSPAARAKLPAPTLTARAEEDSGKTRIRFVWNRVPGATAYEVQRWGFAGEPNASIPVNDRFMVNDTSFVEPGRRTYLNWRVRAYTPGLGFGPRSGTQLFNWQVR